MRIAVFVIASAAALWLIVWHASPPEVPGDAVKAGWFEGDCFDAFEQAMNFGSPARDGGELTEGVNNLGLAGLLEGLSDATLLDDLVPANFRCNDSLVPKAGAGEKRGLPRGRLFRMSSDEVAEYYRNLEPPEKSSLKLPGGWKMSFSPGDNLKGVLGDMLREPEFQTLQKNAGRISEGMIEGLSFELKISF